MALAVFPELAVSGYAIDDLLLQDALLDAVEQALLTLIARSADLLPVLVVGAPLRHGARLYNCAVAIHRGRLLGVVPKVHLPNYREFYEQRQFASGDGTPARTIRIGPHQAPFGPDLLFAAEDLPGFDLHVEICEDMWVPMPPSADGGAGRRDGAGEPVGQPDHHRQGRHSAGCWPSRSRRAAWPPICTPPPGRRVDHRPGLGRPGHDLRERRRCSPRPQRFPAEAQHARRRHRPRPAAPGTAADGHVSTTTGALTPTLSRRSGGSTFRLDPPDGDLGLRRRIERFPFVPADPEALEQDCYEAYNIQVAGLMQRLRATGIEQVVIGVSGGLDSTQALIVAARAMDRLGRPRTDILAFTMPGFATGEHTKTQRAGVDARARRDRARDRYPPDRDDDAAGDGPSVRRAASRSTTSHSRTCRPGCAPITCSGWPTSTTAIVLGTGDLSELALGWCTYGVGDQMSHYNVNAGVPKTLIQHLIRWVITSRQFAVGGVGDAGVDPGHRDLARAGAGGRG